MGRPRNATLSICQLLMVALISAGLQGVRPLLISISLGGSGSSAFCLTFPTTADLAPQVREPW